MRTPKEQKQTSLPESPELRNIVDKYLDEVVGYMKEIDLQKEHIKEVKDVLTDKDGKFNLDPKYVGTLIKARYDKEKLKEQVEALQSALDDIDLLD